MFSTHTSLIDTLLILFLLFLIVSACGCMRVSAGAPRGRGARSPGAGVTAQPRVFHLLLVESEKWRDRKSRSRSFV